MTLIAVTQQTCVYGRTLTYPSRVATLQGRGGVAFAECLPCPGGITHVPFLIWGTFVSILQMNKLRLREVQSSSPGSREADLGPQPLQGFPHAARHSGQGPGASREQTRPGLRAPAWLASLAVQQKKNLQLKWVCAVGLMRVWTRVASEVGTSGGPEQKDVSQAVMGEGEADLMGNLSCEAPAHWTRRTVGIFVGLPIYCQLPTSSLKAQVTSFFCFHPPPSWTLSRCPDPTLPCHSSVLELCCGGGLQGSVRDTVSPNQGPLSTLLWTAERGWWESGQEAQADFHGDFLSCLGTLALRSHQSTETPGGTLLTVVHFWSLSLQTAQWSISKFHIGAN